MESIPLAELPDGIWRRVADHLENAREMTGAEGRTARLSASATPIYRPDQKAAAYFEIEVPVRARASAKGPASGFILAATGPHDWPISHWSLAAEPPSVSLAALARAEGREIDRIYRVDSLTYVGEAKGEVVARLGEMPLRITWPSGDPTAAVAVRPARRAARRPTKHRMRNGRRRPATAHRTAQGSRCRPGSHGRS
jgi:hypothetical protein